MSILAWKVPLHNQGFETRLLIWFFIGDVIEWLESGRSISGVQRVALELLFASAKLAQTEGTFRIGVCAFDPRRSDLLILPLNETLAYFRRHSTPTNSIPESVPKRVLQLLSRPGPKPERRAPPLASGAVVPNAGDHILFLGLVWAPPFIPLFRHLKATGTNFSVLVYDMIQIQRPDLVGEAMGREFAAWLETALQTASIIFVSSLITQRVIVAWADAGKLEALPAIATLRFGMSHLDPSNVRRPRQAVRRRNYALSVGTIDRRKNQSMLFAAWNDLMRIVGPGRTPQLVVVGRRDLPSLDAGTQQLIDQGRILIVEGATDDEVSSLYAHCRFTLFPSLAEGYGLPVAESLRFGKVCITSDLPEVREFAGELVWYFQTGSRDAAMAQILRAVTSPDLLRDQERKIAAAFVPPLWHDAALSMLNAVAAAQPENRTAARPPGEQPSDPM